MTYIPWFFQTCLHSLCRKFPPSVKFRRLFLTELIKRVGGLFKILLCITLYYSLITQAVQNVVINRYLNIHLIYLPVCASVQLEAAGCDPLDELYDALAEVVGTKDTTECYKSYLLVLNQFNSTYRRGSQCCWTRSRYFSEEILGFAVT